MKPLQYKQWELWLYPFLLTCWTENKCVLTMCEYVSWLIPTMFSFPYLAAIYPHFRLVKPWKCNALNCSSKNIETNYTCLANVDIETNIDKLHIFVPWLPPLLLIAKGRFASELRGCLWTSVSHHLHWPAKMAIFVGFDLQKRCIFGGFIWPSLEMLRLWIWSATVGNVWEFISKMRFFEPVSALILKDLYPLNWRGYPFKNKIVTWVPDLDMVRI